MFKPPAGSQRDTRRLAETYAATSKWQHQRGLLSLEIAKPSASEMVLDLGCGTGELSVLLAQRVGPSGNVIAVDPDDVRLQLARKNAPPQLRNLRFMQATGENIGLVGDGSIDLVYSNYALHWALHPSAVFGEVRRILKPGGRFVSEFLGKTIGLFEELVLMMPSGKEAMKENIYLDDARWREIVNAQGLEIKQIEWPRFMLEYKNLHALFNWLEATSQGAFDARKVHSDARAALARRFPGAVTCPCTGVRMVLHRPLP